MFAKMRPFFDLISVRPLYLKRSERATRVKLFFELVDQDAKVYGRERLTIPFFISSLLGLTTFSAVVLYRVSSVLIDKGMPWTALAQLIAKCNCWWNSCAIRPHASIGPGFHIPHPIGVHIGPIRAGRNLIVHQNASLVLADRGRYYLDPHAFPSFGDNVTVGPSALVLGPVVIGDGAVIGAGAVVHKDVPAGCRAVGNPARVIPPETVAARQSPSTQAQKL
jgi:serine acetyltransferase